MIINYTSQNYKYFEKKQVLKYFFDKVTKITLFLCFF